MNQQEFDACKATFPWRQERMVTPSGGLIRMIDKNGMEVPLLQMADFLVALTHSMAAQAQQPQS